MVLFKLSLVFLVAFIGIESVYGKQGIGPGEQDWGYVTVREGAHMFWWLYHTTAPVSDSAERPLVVWLQGGPGASSTGYGNFEELGPLDINLNERNYTWVKEMNVLFIDNPVGSGFSYTDKYEHFTKNNHDIAMDLVQLMHVFFKLQPKFKTVPFYVVAESYGGKMAAEFVYELYNEIQAGKIECNLKGVVLGDSWISPMDSVWAWAPYLYNNGIVDKKGYNAIMEAANETQEAFDDRDFEEATNKWAYTEYVIMNYTSNVDFYNILEKVSERNKRALMEAFESSTRDGLFELMANYGRRAADPLNTLMNGLVAEVLDIPKDVRWGQQSSQTFQVLKGDFMKPCIEMVENLLNKTDLEVVVFTGQLDLIVNTPGTIKWVSKLRWPEKEQWSESIRYPLTVKSIVEGYYQKYGRFSLYWINRSGHMVPNDNPAAMGKILRDLTSYG
ncbi:retinoid-inducible serine carboxypeptidase-like [Ctenocephalides felis]|uniref:retinoid-inducible serine carboxypeptidase-like n=1 Tax=Ctenocephalides felis TaxID=7515 RepID=UPI000E6E36D5|nr:retinoid-inducible serine carboxypeptidase-like [Ctenocephalides felis]